MEEQNTTPSRTDDDCGPNDELKKKNELNRGMAEINKMEQHEMTKQEGGLGDEGDLVDKGQSTNEGDSPEEDISMAKDRSPQEDGLNDKSRLLLQSELAEGTEQTKDEEDEDMSKQKTITDGEGTSSEDVVKEPCVPCRTTVEPVQPEENEDEQEQGEKIWGTIRRSSQSEGDAKDGLSKEDEDKTEPGDIICGRSTSHGSSQVEGDTEGGVWCLWSFVGATIVLTIAIGVFWLMYPDRPRPETDKVPRVDLFLQELEAVKAHFPSQRPELWRRSRIHLERHLQTARPTEPVSLILTAGHKAEKTLHCLATQLASSFSTALNKSVLHINGASMANRDSDQVKLDIDSQLRRAFEGDKSVAVIHRFEELPPGSTLIFYRYCDHENAAYKQVFLTFTVLLPLDEVEEKHSLKDAEEMVQEYINDRFVGSSSQAAYNRMDTDKFSGLWSRISHLVLPVAAESQIEHEGCQST